MEDLNLVNTYAEPVFDEKKVYEIFTEILQNEIYTHNILKLQKIQQTSGGRNQAVEVIEKVHEVGYKHLIDERLVENKESMGCCKEFLCKTFFLAIFVALLYFTIMFYV